MKFAVELVSKQSGRIGSLTKAEFESKTPLLLHYTKVGAFNCMSNYSYHLLQKLSFSCNWSIVLFVGRQHSAYKSWNFWYDDRWEARYSSVIRDKQHTWSSAGHFSKRSGCICWIRAHIQFCYAQKYRHKNGVQLQSNVGCYYNAYRWIVDNAAEIHEPHRNIQTRPISHAMWRWHQCN